MATESEHTEPTPPPRPRGHPEALPWPPKWRLYGEDHPACSNALSQQGFNEDWAAEDFGNNRLDELKREHRNFAGDWWLLAMLIACDRAAREADPELRDPDRFSWWNCHYQRTFDPIVIEAKTNSPRAHLERADLTFAQLSGIDLSLSFLFRARLSLAALNGANLYGADLRQAVLWRAILCNASLIDADLRGSALNLAEIGCAKIGGTNLRRATGLFGRERATQDAGPIREEYSQAAIYSWSWEPPSHWPDACKRFAVRYVRDFASWELLRVIGRLRLFGVSYFTGAVIVVYALLARWYNIQLVGRARVAAAEAQQCDEPTLWPTILSRLTDLPTPRHLGFQLIMIGILALAATIYQFRCPDEAKEASEVQWARAMGQPLWEYRSANWSRPVWRYICAVCFAAGGLYSLGYLTWRASVALHYLFAS